MPIAEGTINFTGETTGWTVVITVQVMGKPVGANEAEVKLETVPWTYPWSVGYTPPGPYRTDSAGKATFPNVWGAFWAFGVKLWDAIYNVKAKLLVDKPPFKSGTESLAHRLELLDGTYNWKRPGEFTYTPSLKMQAYPTTHMRIPIPRVAPRRLI